MQSTQVPWMNARERLVIAPAPTGVAPVGGQQLQFADRGVGVACPHPLLLGDDYLGGLLADPQVPCRTVGLVIVVDPPVRFSQCRFGDQARLPNHEVFASVRRRYHRGRVMPVSAGRTSRQARIRASPLIGSTDSRWATRCRNGSTSVRPSTAGGRRGRRACAVTPTGAPGSRSSAARPARRTHRGSHRVLMRASVRDPPAGLWDSGTITGSGPG